MFLTAFIWGIGVSCGACFGLLLFLVFKSLLDLAINKTGYKHVLEYNRESLEALIKRNEMTVEMIQHLEAIAKSSSVLAEKNP